jgi:large subunit ribosomal protein L28
MSRVCEICGKRTQVGNKLERRGRAKYLGGVGRKITGKTKRTFKPNIQKIRIKDGATVRRARVCTSCLKADKVVKHVS